MVIEDNSNRWVMVFERALKKSERVELKWLHVPVRETTENGSHQRTQPMTANRTYFVIFIT